MVGYGVGYGVNDDLNSKSKPNTFGLTYKPEPPNVVETIKSISEEEKLYNYACSLIPQGSKDISPNTQLSIQKG